MRRGPRAVSPVSLPHPGPPPAAFCSEGGEKGVRNQRWSASFGFRPLVSPPVPRSRAPPCLPRPPRGSGGGARPTGVPRPLKRAGGRPRQASPPPSPPPATTPNPQPGGPGKRGGLRPGGRPLTVPGVCRGGRSGPGSARELVPGRGSMSRGRVDSRRRPAVSLLPGFSLCLSGSPPPAGPPLRRSQCRGANAARPSHGAALYPAPIHSPKGAAFTIPPIAARPGGGGGRESPPLGAAPSPGTNRVYSKNPISMRRPPPTQMGVPPAPRRRGPEWCPPPGRNSLAY